MSFLFGHTHQFLTTIAVVAQQAKILRRELQRTQTSEDETEDVAEDSRLRWGNRRQFYGTNELEKQAAVSSLCTIAITELDFTRVMT